MTRSRIQNLENQAWSDPNSVAKKLQGYLHRQLTLLEGLHAHGSKEKYQRPVRESIMRGLGVWHTINRARGRNDDTTVLPTR